MIRTQREHELARQRVAENRRQAEEYRAALVAEGIPGDGIKRLLDPVLSVTAEIEQEVAEYERARQGLINPVAFAETGRLLVSLRIAKGWSQRRLAEELGVDESAVSRDERNEYQGITIQRAQRIFDVLGASMKVLPVASQSTASAPEPSVATPSAAPH